MINPRQTHLKIDLYHMLLKKIIGSLIIISNVCGLGFVLYSVSMMLKDKFFVQEVIEEPVTTKRKTKEPAIVNDDIIPDEDDLLKDMDLSDLDNLNLDDFE